MKFKYNCLENKLSRVDPNHPEYSYEIEETNQFQTGFGGQGFRLGENSWITFTIYEKKIRVFYKKALDIGSPILGCFDKQLDKEITCYRQDFFKADIISFEFTEEDQVIKNEKGHWVKKTN